MAKNKGKLEKTEEIQEGFIYYSESLKKNVVVISSDKNKLSYTVRIESDETQPTVEMTVPLLDLTKKKKD